MAPKAGAAPKPPLDPKAGAVPKAAPPPKLGAAPKPVGACFGEDNPPPPKIPCDNEGPPDDENAPPPGFVGDAAPNPLPPNTAVEEAEVPNRFVGAAEDAAGAPPNTLLDPPKGFLLAFSAEAWPPRPENIPPPPPPPPKKPPVDTPPLADCEDDVPKTEEVVEAGTPNGVELPKEGAVEEAPNAEEVAVG